MNNKEEFTGYTPDPFKGNSSFLMNNNLEPIYRGCTNANGCFCSGQCREIVGWKNKPETFLETFRKQEKEKGTITNTLKLRCLNCSIMEYVLLKLETNIPQERLSYTRLL
jgi:hypothetical protein